MNIIYWKVDCWTCFTAKYNHMTWKVPLLLLIQDSFNRLWLVFWLITLNVFSWVFMSLYFTFCYLRQIVKIVDLVKHCLAIPVITIHLHVHFSLHKAFILCIHTFSWTILYLTQTGLNFKILVQSMFSS